MLRNGARLRNRRRFQEEAGYFVKIGLIPSVREPRYLLISFLLTIIIGN